MKVTAMINAHKVFVLLWVSIAVVQGTAAVAQVDDSRTIYVLALPPADPPEKKKIVCVKDTVIGSLTERQRNCRTKEQWVEREKEARDVHFDMVHGN